MVPKLDEEAIFHAARRIEAPEARDAYLQQCCGDDTVLRERVEALLRVHDQERSFLQAPAGNARAPREEPPGEAPGAVIGPYRLLERIGEGGMGTVWLAEQTHPVQRRVALKVIRPGMDSQQVVARLEAERQALALMDHPHIAKVLDAGTLPPPSPLGEEGRGEGEGRPFFVMELVQGVPLTTYCDEHHLTPKERLGLFVPVCQAVQHAHQKGVIHRDLKPSNVLVALYDGVPVPKVIDFGIAKALGRPLTERTPLTEVGQVVGTLQYMSPEQAELNQLDIDTRSDIYSLGVLLYELLTGTTPLERERLRDVGLLEVLRLIREEETPRPSARLTAAEELPAIAASRGLEPKKLSGLVRGELDWIVLRALDKDRSRRYQTAGAFAADVQRYLADEPVQACPPSAWYRLGKFARRHRAGLLAAAGALLLLVVAGAGIWSWQHQETLRRAENHFHAELTRRGVESSLLHLKELHRRALWTQAEALLDQADEQLGPEGEARLRQRLRQARRDTAFLKRLDQIRLEKAVIVEGMKFNVAGAVADYPKAFLENGFDVLGDNPADLAAKLKASEVRGYLLAALDDWAMEDSPNRRRIMAPGNRDIQGSP